MNYGHPMQDSEKTAFPTVDIETGSVNESLGGQSSDRFLAQEKEQNIDNLQSLGNKVANSSEWQIVDQDTRELGQIVDLSPDNQISASQLSKETIARTPFKKEVIKTRNGLSKEGIKETERVIKHFEQDGDTANFYEVARDMMEVNLDNSYDRKLTS